MKRLLLYIFLVITVHANTQNNCDNEVSTNFSAPFNTALPSNPDANRYLNSFNWNAVDNNGYLSYYQLQHMQYNQNMLNIMDGQWGNHYNYITESEQMSWENGWELLLMNMGVYPNLEPYGQTLAHSDVPYLVFYNRYNGIIRVFANYGNGYLPSGLNFDAVFIELKFNNHLKLNGVLRLNEGVDQALDKTTNIEVVKSISKHTNSPNKWFSADFQTTFDPCICNFDSKMEINFHFITSESLQLFGRSISVEQDLIDGGLVKDKDFLTSFNNTGTDPENGGMIMYESMDKMVNDYIVKLQKYKDDLASTQEHNKKVNRNLAVLKLFQYTFLQGGNVAIGVISNKPWFGEIVSEAGEFIGDTSVISKKTIAAEAKSILAKGVNTLISKNFTEKAEPKSPNKPTATFTEMYISGTVSDTISISTAVFHTPGTYGSVGTGSPILPSYFNYPLYNQSLGVFALLETPKVRVSHTIQDENNKREHFWVHDGFGGWSVDSYLYQNWTVNYQLKLKEDLKYALNTSLDIESVEISPALVVHTQPKRIPGYTSNFTQVFNDPEFTANVTSTHIETSEFDKINGKISPSPQAFSTVFENGSNHFYPPTPYPNFLYTGFPNHTQKNYNKYSTEFLPIDNFFNHVAGIGLKNEEVIITNTRIPETSPYYPKYDYENKVWILEDLENVEFSQPKLLNPVSSGFINHFDTIILKLKVDVVFTTLNEHGKNNSVSLLLTYVLDPVTSSVFETWDIIPDLENSPVNLELLPQNLVFDNTNFDGSVIDGCVISGNNYQCQAWYDVAIHGNLTTSNYYTVNIIAGNEIVSNPESSVSPEIILEIQPILDFSHPMPPVSPLYLQGFCAGTNPNAPSYQAKSGSKSIQDSNQVVIETTSIQEPKQPFSFSLFPNPTTQQTTVKVNGEYADQVSIVMYDIAGKEQRVAISGEGGRFNLDVAHLAKGLYLVKVSTFGESQTKQLVIN
jgi:hypothetical protein